MRLVISLSAIGGCLGALAYLSVIAGGAGALILGYLSPLPLFLVGLWAGGTAAALAALVGAITVAILSGSPVVPLSFLGSVALPAVALSRQALLTRQTPDGDTAWYPLGRALMVLTGLGFAALAVGIVVTMDEPGGLRGVLSDLFEAMVGQMGVGQTGAGQTAGANLPAPDPQLTSWMTAVLPGLIVVSWMMMTIINGALAQGLLVRFTRARRPDMMLSDLTPPHWVPMAFAAALATATVAPDPLGFWALNGGLILAVPLGFAGLAVVHAFARQRGAKVALLAAFYVFLFVFGWPIALLVGLGVIETWTGLSRRLRAGRNGQED